MSPAARSSVWITGVGSVTAAGVGMEPLARLVREGRSAVRAHPSLEGLEAGWVEGFRPERRNRHLDRSASMLLAAAEEAWSYAGSPQVVADRGALVEGSSLGPMADLLSAHTRRKSRRAGVGRPLDLVRFMPGAGGVAFARRHALRGPVLHLSAGSASAGCAIALAADLVSSGAVDVALAGGAECPLQVDVVTSFVTAGIVTSSCRPFDRRRCGTILGEGAGALVLESESSAVGRGARALAILSGWGTGGENGSRVRPDPEGTAVREAARRALDGRDAARLGWIKAHGTGTLHGDAAEYGGLASLLGPSLGSVPVTSLKSALGHCLGASGAVETVAGILALRAGVVPPTFGTRELDPAMPGLTIATQPLEGRSGAVLLLFESFGGRCTALVVEAPL